MKDKKIVHLTSAHLRYDIRIFQKECVSLALKGYDVTLVVADGNGNETVNGVKICDAVNSMPKSRLSRILKFPKLVLKEALKLDAEIYHFHDPELIPVALKLLRAGKKVIYDIHEDLPRQTLTKEYIPKLFRLPLSIILEYYENWSINKFSAIVTATPFIHKRIVKLNPNCINVNNYPLISEFTSSFDLNSKENAVCFVGALSRLRGIRELIEAAYLAGFKLYLAGRFSEYDFHEEMKMEIGWKNVVECGQLDREGVAELMSRCICGMVTFLPAPNHGNSQPNKMFEYMSAGLPVICSDFPLWKAIIESEKCGVCVDPSEPRAIADAILKVSKLVKGGNRIGENGKLAVQEKFNWEMEKKKLYEIYYSLV